jgi:hypothetical protein
MVKMLQDWFNHYFSNPQVITLWLILIGAFLIVILSGRDAATGVPGTHHRLSPGGDRFDFYGAKGSQDNSRSPYLYFIFILPGYYWSSVFSR